MKRGRTPARTRRQGGGNTGPGRASRAHAAAPRAAAAPVNGAEFVTMLKRGEVADPHNAELKHGRPVRLRPFTGQAASVLLRLESLLVAACAGTQVQVRARPLVRLGPQDMWRPHLALVQGRHLSAIHAEGATAEARDVRLVVLLHRGEPSPERLAGYAAAGVSELWSVSLCEGWTVRYRSPWSGRYQSRTLWYPGENVPVAALAGTPVEALEEGFRPAGLFAGGPDCGRRL